MSTKKEAKKQSKMEKVEAKSVTVKEAKKTEVKVQNKIASIKPE